MKIDGNALRAARREALGEKVTYTLGGASVEFPSELPLTVVDLNAQAVDEKWDDARYYRSLFLEILGAEQWDRLWAEKPSLADLSDAWQALLNTYAVGPGESNSSPDLSATGGESSKPKPAGSTKRTRPRSVSAA